MKKVISNNRILHSFATLFVLLSSLCILSSCREDFDFENAHAVTVQQQFANTFVDHFGQPSEDNEWGFDKANAAFQGITASPTRAFYKQDQYANNIDGIKDSYPLPNDITDREHKEVFAWFSCHKVEWVKNPSYFQGTHDNPIVGNVATYIPEEEQVKVLLQSKNHSYSANDDKTYYDYPYNQLGSLENYTTNCARSQSPVSVNPVPFENGWIQQVAYKSDKYDPNVSGNLPSVLLNGEEYYNAGNNSEAYVKRNIDGNDVFVRADVFGNLYYNYVQTEVKYYYKVIENWNPKYYECDKNGYNKSKNGYFSWEISGGIDENKLVEAGKTLLNGTYYKYERVASTEFYTKLSENTYRKVGDATGQKTIPDNDPKLSLALYTGSNQLNQVKQFQNLVTSSGMDYFCTTDVLNHNSEIHIADWNGTNAYGYDQAYTGNLVLGAYLNNWYYKCSADGGKKHDKYIIVYLEGEDYAGYYLGFDYEAYDEDLSQNNRRCKADGICNDYIIKLADAPKDGPRLGDNYNPCRIMCEDLGSTDYSDIDYNDIVIDVTYSTPTSSNTSWLWNLIKRLLGIADNNTDWTVQIDVRATGATLPIAVFYDDNPNDAHQGVGLFEAHEFLFNGESKGTFGNANHKMASNKSAYETMINTGASTQNVNGSSVSSATKNTQSFYIISNNQHSGFYNNNNYFVHKGSKFDINNLVIRSYQAGIDSYISDESTAAEWVELKKLEGYNVPLKFCIPLKNSKGQEIKWLKERKAIDSGYPNFYYWVTGNMDTFWENNVNGSDLY